MFSSYKRLQDENSKKPSKKELKGSSLLTEYTAIPEESEKTTKLQQQYEKLKGVSAFDISKANKDAEQRFLDTLSNELARINKLQDPKERNKALIGCLLTQKEIIMNTIAGNTGADKEKVFNQTTNIGRLINSMLKQLDVPKNEADLKACKEVYKTVKDKPEKPRQHMEM